MPESKLLLDRPARVTWVEGMRVAPEGKLLPDVRSKDLESVREALRFVKEALSPDLHNSPQIHTGDITLHPADIERMYAAIANPT